MIYTASPASYIEALAKVFNARFPGVRMRTYSATAAPLLERFMADSKRGAVQADLVQTSDDMMQRLLAEKLIEPYDPASAAVIPPEYRALSPYALPDRLIENVVIYNVDMVTEEEIKLLQSWDGVVDPRFKGRIAVADPNVVGGWYNGFYMLWKSKGPEWFTKLAAVKPTIYSSNIPGVESVISGQHAVGLTIDPYASSYFANKAPIQTAWPEPTPIWFGYVALAKGAPHSNAAKLFLEWFFSEEGMLTWAKIYQCAVPRPGISDVRAFAHEPWFTGARQRFVLKPADLAKEGKLALADWNKAMKG